MHVEYASRIRTSYSIVEGQLGIADCVAVSYNLINDDGGIRHDRRCHSASAGYTVIQEIPWLSWTEALCLVSCVSQASFISKIRDKEAVMEPARCGLTFLRPQFLRLQF